MARWLVFALALLPAIMLGRSSSTVPSTDLNDLDSIAFTSDHIVEGRLVWPRYNGSLWLMITDTYHGTLKKGDEVFIPGLLDQQRPGTGYGDQPLEENDRLVLFLQDQPAPRPCAAVAIFLIVHGQVCRLENPPWGAMAWQMPRPSPNSPTLREFRDRLGATLVRTTEVHAKLAEPTTPDNTAWFVNLLRRHADRSDPFDPGGMVSLAIAKRLAELNDLSIADQVITSDFSTAAPFMPLFATRQGREHLLDRLCDRSVSREHRMTLAEILSGTCGVYRMRRNYYENKPWLKGTTPDANNSQYFARIAKAATSYGTEDPEMSVAILRALGQLFGWGWNYASTQPRIRADVHESLGVLREAYIHNTLSEPVCYEIEKVTAEFGYREYQALGSKCGPIISLVEPVDLTDCAAPTTATLFFNYQCENISRDFGDFVPSQTATFAVLEPVNGGQRYAIPCNTFAGMAPGSTVGGMSSIPLPPNFRPGKYRVHYQLMNGSSVVSEGHSAELLVPQRSASQPAPSIFSAHGRSTIHWRRSWTISLLTIFLLIASWLIVRRLLRSRRGVGWFKKGKCPGCGYDLRASRDRCSECGKPLAAELTVHLFRRRLARLSGGCVLFLGVSILGFCVRSYYVGDVVTRSTFDRSDTASTTRGSLLIEWTTIGSDAEWEHERVQPADLPRTATDFGTTPQWRFFGLEYSPASDLFVVPLWLLTVIAIIAGYLLLRLRRATTIGMKPI